MAPRGVARKRVRREAGESSHSSPPRREFWSPIRDDAGNETNYEAVYHSLLQKKHIPGRWIVFDKFRFHTFSDKLVSMGWDDFLTQTIKGVFYPRLVSQFYANLKPFGDDMLVSLVKGVEIFVSPSLLHEILLIPNEGLDLVNTTVDEIEEVSHFEDVFKGQVTAFSKDLKEEARMIHKVICANIITKKGNFDRITEDALKVIYCFMRNIRFNLAGLIFDRMSEAMNLPSLPYGLIITRILTHYGIELSNEVPAEPETPFSDKSLNLMRIQAAEIEEEQEAEAAAEEQQVPAPAENIIEELRKNREEMERIRRGQRKIHKRQGIIMKSLRSLTKKVGVVMKHLGCTSSSSVSVSQPRPQPPPSPVPSHGSDS